MKAWLYVGCLVLSLPNLLIGLAVAVVRRTIASRHPIQMVLDFLESVVWGVPVAAGVLLVLLLAGIITESRPYAAACALLLNLLALGLVLWRLRVPTDLWEAALFVPALLALAGFSWLALGLCAHPVELEINAER